MLRMAVLSALCAALSAPGGEPRSISWIATGDVRQEHFAACQEAVSVGREVFLSVGVDPQAGDYSATDLTGDDGKPVKSARYRCYKEVGTGRHRMQEVDGKGNPVVIPAQAAAEVRPTATFPGQSVRPTVSAVGVTNGGANPVVAGDKSHFCPTCGTGEWRAVMGFNPDGTHNHRCEKCGTVFTH